MVKRTGQWTRNPELRNMKWRAKTAKTSNDNYGRELHRIPRRPANGNAWIDGGSGASGRTRGLEGHGKGSGGYGGSRWFHGGYLCFVFYYIFIFYGRTELTRYWGFPSFLHREGSRYFFGRGTLWKAPISLWKELRQLRIEQPIYTAVTCSNLKDK